MTPRTVKAAALAGVAGAAIVAGVLPAVADTTGANLFVTPSANLVDGQGVDVEFDTGVLYSLYPDGPTSVALYECRQPTYSSDSSTCVTVGSITVDPGLSTSYSHLEYFGSRYLASDLVHNPHGFPQVKVRQSWSWVRSISGVIERGTTSCSRNCYLVAQGPGLGSAPSSASKQLIFGAPK